MIDILKAEAVIQDAVALAKQVQMAETLLAPLFPQIVEAAKKLEVDGSALLGIGATPNA